MKGLQLLATGGALPGRVVTNEDLSRQVDTSDEWITTRTGIRQRYYCTESEDAATLAIAAARQALARSGLAASEIACCVAATLSAPTATPSVACRVQAALGLPENRPAFDVNGTSTHLNDSCETAAIKSVFGSHAYELAVSSTKSMTGHLLGGAGGVEGVFTVLALHDAFLPATVNLQEPDPELDLDYIPNQGRALQVDYAMSDSLGFGGHNACVVFKRWEG